MAPSQRKPGSGLANVTATAVETLLAGVLAGSDAVIEQAFDILLAEHTAGRCGIAPRRVLDLLSTGLEQLGLAVSSARRSLPGSPGDVSAVTEDGDTLWFEVKAQTKKVSFNDLTQADWVRDRTDALAWIAAHDAVAVSMLPAATLRLLLNGTPPGPAWGFADLWLADLALLTDSTARRSAGVSTPSELAGFLRRKFVVHLTSEGLRIACLADLQPIQSVLDGVTPAYVLKKNVSSDLAVAVSVGCSLGPMFTYHVYPPAIPGTMKGRHKLHARAFDGGRCITVR